jgi:hypothetical protein
MFGALILLTAICTFPLAAVAHTVAQPYAGQQGREI